MRTGSPNARPNRLLPMLPGIALLLVAAWAMHRQHHRAIVSFTPAQAYVAPDRLTPFQHAVVTDLDRQVAANIRYQDGYFTGGDPPPDIGVCTDVVVRSYRAAGIDIHGLVARDIRRHPRGYNIAKPDPNIDYRRCRNLAVFFKKYATSLPTKGKNADWEPADLIIFDVSGNGYPNHIAVVANGLDQTGAPTIVHHWPGNPVAQTAWPTMLPILYHFRWKPPKVQTAER